MVLGPEDIVGRPVTKLVDVFPAPGNHLRKSFSPARLGLPPDVALDRTRIEPVAGILPKPVAGHLAQLLERHLEGLGYQLDHTSDRGRLLRSGVIDGAERRVLCDEMDGPAEIAGVDIGLLGP